MRAVSAEALPAAMESHSATASAAPDLRRKFMGTILRQAAAGIE
jgi:hypothetical protein